MQGNKGTQRSLLYLALIRDEVKWWVWKQFGVDHGVDGFWISRWKRELKTLLFKNLELAEEKQSGKIYRVKGRVYY